MEASVQSLPDSGLICLSLLCQFHEIVCDIKQIEHEYQGSERLSANDVCRIAKQLGLKSQISSVKAERLRYLPLPLIAEDNNGLFFVITGVNDDSVVIYNPLSSTSHEVPIHVLDGHWNGRVIQMVSRANLNGEIARFD